MSKTGEVKEKGFFWLLFNNKVKELDENVIKPAFQLPDQNSFDDIKDIENSLGTTNDENDENDPIADATIK